MNTTEQIFNPESNIFQLIDEYLMYCPEAFLKYCKPDMAEPEPELIIGFND
jgi:hypothetical protein